MGTEIEGWGDKAMFAGEPHEVTEGHGVMPKVHLLWMTPDPLGAIAAMTEMYKGKVVRSLDDITNLQRSAAFEDVQKTHLKAPLEAVKLHFMIEGVDRSFTHQLVRQRTAVYAQESMRFAVIDDLMNAVSLPPSLWGVPLPRDDTESRNAAERNRRTWETAVRTVQSCYQRLIQNGMPQEEARGLLPHATATRVNYVTDLRNLTDHAGNRLCTQAQFHWRIVFAQITKAIRNATWQPDGPMSLENGDAWQFQTIADSNLFRPVCYAQNKCPFQASFDRACSIRERVEKFSEAGVSSDKWDEGARHPGTGAPIAGINNAEWLLDDQAARVR